MHSFRQTHATAFGRKPGPNKACGHLRAHRGDRLFWNNRAPIDEFGFIFVQQSSQGQKVIGRDLIGSIKNAHDGFPIQISSRNLIFQSRDLEQLKQQILTIISAHGELLLLLGMICDRAGLCPL